MLVLRTIYLDPDIDDALTEEARRTRIPKNDLLRKYLRLGMEVAKGKTMTATLWEILVPTEKRLEPGKFYRTKYHQVWDEKVRAISGGLTIMQPAKGQWVSPCGTIFIERMIPVRIIATREQIEQIIDMTMVYYDQLAVLCYRLSDEVILKHREAA